MPRPTMTLPRPTRARLRAFWLTGDGLAGTALEAGALRLGPHWVAIALPVGLVVTGLTGWFDPDLVRPVYERWNDLARVARHALRIWILLLAFQVVRTVGRTGAADGADGTPRSGSGWRPRETTERRAYPAPSPFPAWSGSRGWAAELRAWARRSGRPWVLALVPYLWLLRALGGRFGGGPAGHNYTLY